jgi:hypothetical protein
MARTNGRATSAKQPISVDAHCWPRLLYMALAFARYQWMKSESEQIS